MLRVIFKKVLKNPIHPLLGVFVKQISLVSQVTMVLNFFKYKTIVNEYNFKYIFKVIVGDYAFKVNFHFSILKSMMGIMV